MPGGGVARQRASRPATAGFGGGFTLRRGSSKLTRTERDTSNKHMLGSCLGSTASFNVSQIWVLP